VVSPTARPLISPRGTVSLAGKEYGQSLSPSEQAALRSAIERARAVAARRDGHAEITPTINELRPYEAEIKEDVNNLPVSSSADSLNSDDLDDHSSMKLRSPTIQIKPKPVTAFPQMSRPQKLNNNKSPISQIRSSPPTGESPPTLPSPLTKPGTAPPRRTPPPPPPPVGT